MASEVLTAATGIGGVIVGAAGAVLGARIQARGAHAQADAASENSIHQITAAHKNWMASDRAHAYAALVTEALILENAVTPLTVDFNRSGNPWWSPGWRPRGYRQRMNEYSYVAFNVTRLGTAVALVDLYGDDPARHHASTLLQTAEQARESALEWALEPAEAPPAHHLPRLQEQRARFTRAAREDLRGSPAS